MSIIYLNFFLTAGNASKVKDIICLEYVTFISELFWQNGSNFIAQRINNLQEKKQDIQKRIQMVAVPSKPASCSLMEALVFFF